MFHQFAEELKMAKATAEVYAIDFLPAGQYLDHQTIAKYLDICEDSFERIKGEITSNNDKKLCTLRDKLREAFSNKQIRFVLACPFYIYFPLVLSFILLPTFLNAEIFWYFSYLNSVVLVSIIILFPHFLIVLNHSSFHPANVALHNYYIHFSKSFLTFLFCLVVTALEPLFSGAPNVAMSQNT